MYEDLVKRLRNCAIEAAPCKTCNMAEDGSCTDTLMKQAADAIEELIAERDAYCKAMTEEHNKAARLTWEYRWIPVTERMPSLNTPVLATDGIEVDISWMYGVPPRWITSYTAIDEDKLTHWMPLPQTPKEES